MHACQASTADLAQPAPEDRVEEHAVGAARLRPELGTKSNQDDAAGGEGDVEERALVGEVLLAQDPAAEIRVAERVARDDRAVAGELERGAIDEYSGLVAVQAPAERVRRVDDDPQERAGAIELLAVQPVEDIADRQPKA